MDREAWHAAVHGVAKNRTWLGNWTKLSLMPLTARCFCHQSQQKWNIQGSCFLSAISQTEMNLVNLEVTETMPNRSPGVAPHVSAFSALVTTAQASPRHFGSMIPTQALARGTDVSSSRLVSWEKTGLVAKVTCTFQQPVLQLDDICFLDCVRKTLGEDFLFPQRQGTGEKCLVV